jgi:hypothetical protein
MAQEVTTSALQRPTKQDQAEFEDCTPCRIVGKTLFIFLTFPTRSPLGSRSIDIKLGSATFVGLGAFTYVSGHSQLRVNEATVRASKSMFGMKSRRAAITSTASVMVGLGIYRWFS